MPFKSIAQERFLFAKHPEIAAKWAANFGQPKDLPKYVHNGKPSSQTMTSPWVGLKTSKGDK